MLRTRLFWGVLIAGMIGCVAFSGYKGLPHKAPLLIPGSQLLKDFTLTDQQGKPFGTTQLSGHVWIANFIFTSCAGQCPQMTELMKKLQDQIPVSPGICLVSITVDPERDTPEVLSRFAQEHGADSSRWHFITGDRAEIEHLCKEGFRLSYAEGGGPDEPITHSSRFILIDRNGTIRGYYDGTDPKSVKQLLQDSQRLAA